MEDNQTESGKASFSNDNHKQQWNTAHNGSSKGAVNCYRPNAANTIWSL